MQEKSQSLGVIRETGGAITGWARDPNDPEALLTVELRTEHAIVGYVKADKATVWGADDAGADGHFFWYRFPQTGVLRVPARIRGRVLEHDRDLDGHIEVPDISRLKALSTTSGATTGGYMGLNSGMLTGWIANQEDLNLRYEVDLFVGGEKLASGLASAFREDLLRQGIGDGCYGYAFYLPISVFSGQGIVVEVRLSQTSHPAPGFPIYMGETSLSSLLETVQGENARLSERLQKIARLLGEDTAISEESLVRRLQDTYYNRTEAMLEVYKSRTERAFAEVYRRILALEKHQRH